MYTIYVYNTSTVVTDQQCVNIVNACAKHLIGFCNVWNVLCPKVIFMKGSNVVIKNGIWSFVITDDSDTANALAYHQDTDNQIAGYVFAKTILDYGGVIYYKDAITSTVGSALFHELAETIIDPACNVWWDDAISQYFAGEVCDPVQGNIIPVQVKVGRTVLVVGVSDYITPSWADPYPPNNAIFNYKRTLSAPFTLDNAGYAIVMTYTGDQTLIYGLKGNEQKLLSKNNKFSRIKYLGAELDKIKVTEKI